MEFGWRKKVGTDRIWSMGLLRRLGGVVTVQDHMGTASGRFVPRWLDFCVGREAARRRCDDDVRIFKQQQGGVAAAKTTRINMLVCISHRSDEFKAPFWAILGYGELRGDFHICFM